MFSNDNKAYPISTEIKVDKDPKTNKSIIVLHPAASYYDKMGYTMFYRLI
jgi:hypothetical protein